MVLADTFEAAREAAYKVKSRLRRGNAERDLRLARRDARRTRARSPSGTRTCRKPATPRRRLRRPTSCIDAEYATPAAAPQSDRAVHHHLRLERRPADHLRAEPVRLWAEERRRRAARHRRRTRSAWSAPMSAAPSAPRAADAAHRRSSRSPPERLNRPVKLVATPRQGFTIATYRAETRHHIRLGAGATASSSASATRAGRSRRGPTLTWSPASKTARGSTPSARCETNVTIVHADRNTPGFMRSPPVVPYIFALESAMDELAVKLDMDPVELRRVNDTMTDPIGQALFEPLADACYDEAAEAFGWTQRDAEPRLDARRRLAGRLGLRHALSIRPISAPRPRACGCTPDGQARVQIAGARDRHRRLHRDRRRLAAERLGIPLSHGHGRARRQRSAAGAGRRRLEHHREHLLGRDEGLRRDPRKLFRAAATANDGRSPGATRSGRAQGRHAERAGRRREKLEDAFKRARRQRDRGICRIRRRTAQARRDQEALRRQGRAWPAAPRARS